MEALPPLYCSRVDLEEIFSDLAIDVRIDDSADDTAPATSANGNEEAAIREATDEVNFYLQHRYLVADLSESLIVKRWTAWIACHLLSRRRGNPGQFEDEYNRIMIRLDQIRQGKEFIPRVKPRADFRPMVANMVIDRRFLNSKIRVDTESSSANAPDELSDYLNHYR